MSFLSLNILKNRGINELTIILTFLTVISCNKDDSNIDNDYGIAMGAVAKVEIPKRSGPRPKTTEKVPHVQIGVEPVSEVNEELFRRVYSIPGIENRRSVIAGWRGLWLNEQVTVFVPEATIDGREFAHIHNDGSLHIFLDPFRGIEAVESCWAIFHPFAVERREGWDGFVMLYTPQSFDELDVTFQLIVDGYNYVTAQNLLATDYY
jgi:phospholipase/carboxylesterase